MTSSAEIILRPDAQELAHLERWDIDLPVAQYQRDIYIPLAPLCQAMGIASNGQIRRIREHPVMAKHFRRFYLSRDGAGKNTQATACISERVIGFWLGTISVNQVRAELRDWLLEFQEALVDAAHLALKQHLQRTPLTPESVRSLVQQLARLDGAHADTVAFCLLLDQRIADIEQVLFQPDALDETSEE